MTRRRSWAPVAALGIALSLARCSSDVQDLTDVGALTGPSDAATDAPVSPRPDVPVGAPDAPADGAVTGTDTGGTADTAETSVCGLCAGPDQVCCPTLRVCFVPGTEDCPATHPDAGLDAADAAIDAADAAIDVAALDTARDAPDDVRADVREDVHADVPDPCMGRCSGITVCCPATRFCFLPGRGFCPSYDAGVSRCGGVVCAPSAVCCPTTNRCVPRTCTFCCP